MKHAKFVLLLSSVIILNGCAAWVSTDQYNGQHRHNRVSLGVHAHGSGKGALGALIIGGIIGAVINQASHEAEEKELEKHKQSEKLAKEKTNQDQKTQENLDRQRLDGHSKVTKWYQFGKDAQCYEMQTVSGITDVLASVDEKFCND